MSKKAVKQVTAFKTSDEGIWETYAEAVRWELELVLIAAFTDADENFELPESIDDLAPKLIAAKSALIPALRAAV